MDSLKDKILDKLQDLPEPSLREVLSFVDFITWRSTTDESPLLSVAGILSGNPVSAQEIEKQLYGTRELDNKCNIGD